MIKYLYIRYDEAVYSDDEPTSLDMDMMKDGDLTILKIDMLNNTIVDMFDNTELSIAKLNKDNEHHII